MATKEQIINEYLLGGFSYRALAKKYGFSRTTINNWVMGYEGTYRGNSVIEKSSNLELMKKNSSEILPQEIVELQKQLKHERLHNKLLTAMIDIAEQELKIPIRKKYGTKRWKK